MLNLSQVDDESIDDLGEVKKWRLNMHFYWNGCDVTQQPGQMYTFTLKVILYLFYLLYRESVDFLGHFLGIFFLFVSVLDSCFLSWLPKVCYDVNILHNFAHFTSQTVG